MWRLYEAEYGDMKLSYRPNPRVPVAEYLSRQGRFGHLTPDDVEAFQANVDREWENVRFR
jgi:pyruvate/2-oxoacid:ferredoxin oxidoreductase beta subunit